MALNNETYITHTATAGDVIVPIDTIVPYLNISLIGYQYYSYHSVMSQNIANLADDIKTLQDGGAAAATFDLAALVASTQTQIDTQITSLESSLQSKIVYLTDQAVSETKTRLDNFNLVLNGDGGAVKGVVQNIDTVTQTVGSATSGLVKKVDTVVQTVGDTTSGLVQQVNGYSAIVSQIQTDSTDISNIQLTLNSTTSGVLKRLTDNETKIGDATSGLIKDSLQYKGLLPIVGDINSGLVYQVNTIESNLSAYITNTDNRLSYVETIVSTGANSLTTNVATLLTDVNVLQNDLGTTSTTGLRGRVAILETTDIAALNDTITNSTTGLVTAVNTNTTNIATNTTNIATNTSNITTMLPKVANIATNTTNIATNTTNIATIDTDLNAVGGIKEKINSITANYFTYNVNGTAVVVTPSKLISTYSIANELSTKNIISQFETYFGTSTTGYLPKSNLGLDGVNTWIADTTSAGYTTKTNTIVSNYLSSNYTMSDIALNKADLTLLKGSVSTTGSINYTIDSYVTAAFTSYDSTLNGTTGSITIINGADTVVGSTDYKIKNTVTPINNTITTIQTDVVKTNDFIKNQVDEIQVEMARYDTILPFLQKMFKHVNDGTKITDTEIDTIFNTVQTNIDTLSNTINSSGYTVKFVNNGGGGLNNFSITIILDKDLKFAELNQAAPTGDMALIVDPDDPSIVCYAGLSADVNGAYTQTDSAGNLVLDSGILVTTAQATFHNLSDDTVNHEVTDITIAPDNNLEFHFGTIDIFGQFKLNKVLIT